jgi:hypothetical protein
MKAELFRRVRTSQVIVSCSVFLTIACSFLPLLLIASPANAAPVVLVPGETRENIAAAGRVVQSTSPIPVDPGTVARSTTAGTVVTFSREDAFTQNIFLYAGDTIVGFGAEVARGILFVDFCVPRPGMGACDSVADPNAPDITVSLTFQYGVIGSAMTKGVLADASLALTGSVVDLEKGGFVAFQDLLRNDLSSHGIQFAPISIEWVPVPLPNYTNAKTTQPVTFPAILLKRGRIYRFQLSAAASADGDGYIDAFGTRCGIYFSGCDQGRVMLRNVSVTVSQDLTGNFAEQLKNLQAVVGALQEQLGNLVTRIDTLEADLQDSIAALNAANANRGKRHDGDGHDRHERHGSDKSGGW